MRIKTLFRILGIGVVWLAAIILSDPAHAQSCALCYTQAASSGSHMIQALRSGILVLIVPPTLMWLVVVAVMYIKRNKYQHVDHALESDRSW
ncbi:MAG: hypothetical protein ACHQIK_06715 [Candidatus Acidiferrales bacterium]